MNLQRLARNPYAAGSLCFILFAFLTGNMGRRKNDSVKLLSFFVGLGCFYPHWLHTLWLLELISASISFLNELPGIRIQIAQSTTYWDSMSIFLRKKLFGYLVLLATTVAVPVAYYFFHFSRSKMWITFIFTISLVYYCLTGSKFAKFARKRIHSKLTDREKLNHLTPVVINLVTLCMSMLLCAFICWSQGATRVSVYCLLFNICSAFDLYYSQSVRYLLQRRQDEFDVNHLWA